MTAAKHDPATTDNRRVFCGAYASEGYGGAVSSIAPRAPSMPCSQGAGMLKCPT